jgi:hypothetical protein
LKDEGIVGIYQSASQRIDPAFENKTTADKVSRMLDLEISKDVHPTPQEAVVDFLSRRGYLKTIEAKLWVRGKYAKTITELWGNHCNRLCANRPFFPLN